MREAVVIGWTLSEGEKVEKGAVLLTLETDKTTSEVESPATGRLVSIVAKSGASVVAGDLLGIIESD
jgi:pyruvate/2-oxoglutarate dehydrogenase complex dihydrolipoamide acyltransferase (E2) component